MGHVDVLWNCGVYSWVDMVGPLCGREGGVERCLHDDADVPIVPSSLWYQKGLCVGV